MILVVYNLRGKGLSSSAFDNHITTLAGGNLIAGRSNRCAVIRVNSHTWMKRSAPLCKPPFHSSEVSARLTQGE